MKNSVFLFSRFGMLLLCLALTAWARAQAVEGREIPLAGALKLLSVHYRVNFIYEDLTVSGKTVSESVNLFKEKSVNKCLDRILPPLGLAWFNIDNQNYAIYPVDRRPDSGRLSRAGPSPDQRPDILPVNAIGGIVLDETSHPQAFITVALCVAADSATLRIVVCDTAGLYRFTGVKPGNYLLKAFQMGYHAAWSAPVNLPAGGSVTVAPLQVKAVSRTLAEVTIRGSRPLVERKSDRFIFNVEHSAMASGSSFQLLQSAPFVTVSPDNVVSLQGKRTLILIDGRPIPGGALEDVLQTLPAGNISSVELITDPSSKYDAAYGAVINLITKKSGIEGFTGNIRSEFSQGDYARANTSGRFTYKHDQLTLFGSAGYNRLNIQQHDDSYRTLAADVSPVLIHEQIVRTFYQNLPNFEAGGNLDISERQSLGILFSGRWNHTHGSFNSGDGFGVAGGGQDSLLNTRSPFHTVQHSLDYNVNYHLLSDSGKNELAVLSTLSPISRTMVQDFTSVLLDPSGNMLRTPAPYQSATTSRFLIFTAQADYTRLLTRQWKLETGVKYQSTDSRQTINFKTDSAGVLQPDPGNSSNNHLSEAILGVYGTLNKKWKNDQFRLGLRAENTDDEYAGFYHLRQLDWFPSALFLHDFNAQDNISLSYRRTVDRAPYTELVPYRLIINQYNINLGNPSLKPQFNDYFSLNTRFGGLNILVNYTLTKGFIAQTPEREDLANKITYIFYQNLDRQSDLAVDVFYPLQLTSWWNTQNTATLFSITRARGQVLGEPVSVATSRHAIRSNQTFKLSSKVKFELDGYYYSHASDGLTRYGGFHNLDAALMVDMLAGKGQLRLGAYDILKKNVYYSAQDFRVYSFYRNRYLDSQRGSISFTYNFGQTRIKAPNKKLGNEDAIDRTR